MVKHKRAVIALTCSIFLVVCLLSLYRLFCVSELRVNYSVYNENVEEVESILSKYSGKCIFFVNVNEIEREITSDRYLKVASVKKNYPCTIEVDLVERIERYALKSDRGWYFLDDEFFAVRTDSSENSLRGELLTKITFFDIEGNELSQSCALKKVFEFPSGTNSSVREMLGGLGSRGESVKEIRLVFTREQGNYYVRFYMTEGVAIEVQKAGEQPLEKLKKGLDYYETLSPERKMRGTIVVNKTSGGVIKAVHSA